MEYYCSSIAFCLAILAAKAAAASSSFFFANAVKFLTLETLWISIPCVYYCGTLSMLSFFL